MDRETVLRLFGALSVWSRGGQRAPNTPLLVLYALGCWARGEAEVTFATINDQLTTLLREFGPPRRAIHPEYPFWRLQNDGVWAVSSDGVMSHDRGSSDIPKRELLRLNARGSFVPDIQNAFRSNPSLVAEVARLILQAHFPGSLHQDILNAVGLPITDGAGGGRRDPRFRNRVLIAYEHRCAVCGFQVLLSGLTVALDAAHIKWHQAAGPDHVTNGIALCVMHHKLFDLGAFTLSAELTLLVSEETSGAQGFAESLMTFHNTMIRMPVQPESSPSLSYLKWHYQQVFRGQPRH